MKPLFFLALFSLSVNLSAQSAGGWTWLDLEPLDASFISELAVDDNEGIYFTTNGSLFYYDGDGFVNKGYDDEAMEIDRNYFRGIDLIGDSIIWASNVERVMSYHIANDEWEVFDPNNGMPLTNPNAYDVAVEEDGTVWWAANRSGYELSEGSWTRTVFQTSGVNMTNSVRSVQVDGENNKWFETSFAICFDIACFIPPGLAMIDDAGTTSLFSVDSLGLPEARGVKFKVDRNGVGVAIVSELIDEVWVAFRMDYANGEWTEPTELPLLGSVTDLAFDESNKLFLRTSEGIEFETGNGWSLITVDPDRMRNTYAFEVVDNKVYLGGSYDDANGRSHSALGFYEIGAFFITGSTYWDANANGVKDSLESGLTGLQVTTSTDNVAFSVTDGYYSLNLQTGGMVEVMAAAPQYFLPVLPQNGDTTVSIPAATGVLDSLDFGFFPDTTATDLRVVLNTINNANPGDTVGYYLNLTNLAPRATAGQVNFTFDSRLEFVSANHPSLAVDGNLLTFAATLAYRETERILIRFRVPQEVFVIGDTIFLSGNILISNGQTDLDESNNTFAVEQVTTGPFDPNYITVSPKGEGSGGNVPTSTSSLLYTIYFQNIGNDTARNVYITNVVDRDLNLATLEVESSSHDHRLEPLNSGRGIRWIFPDIDLVDSLTNEIGSIGFISYRIAPTTQAEGTEITNQADIFFDFNEPIRTNTTLTTLTDPIIDSVTPEAEGKENCINSLYVSDQKLVVEFPELFTGRLEVFTISGRQVLSRSVRESVELTVPLRLPAGIYVARLAGEDCATAVTFWND